MARYARIERERLADTLLEVGPDAPTLCTGWTAADLAAHVVIRERRPDASGGILLKPLAGWTEHVQRRYRDSHAYPELVAMVRQPPWWSLLELPGLDEATNLLEFFVHHEDVRRAQPEWPPRELEPELAQGLWKRVSGMAKLRLRRFPAKVAVVAPGVGQVTAGGDDGGPAVALRGEPGELTRLFFGRQGAARVELDGPDDLVAKLRRVRTAV